MPATSSSRIRTLGLRTDLAIERDRTVVEEHEGFIAVRTPSNPGYYFGNCLIFDGPPQASDDECWPQTFERIFAADPAVRHTAFAWSMADQAGAVESFVRRGYTFAPRVVMTADVVCEFPIPQGLRVRALRSRDDWSAQLELALANREEQYEAQAYARFKTAQVAHQRQIAQRFGVWLGAFDGPHLAGSCGIFSVGAGVARYQDVGVLPAYRNRGIARCLIGAAGRFARERLAATQLVIVADAGGFARALYERAGFDVRQREGALWIASR